MTSPCMRLLPLQEVEAISQLLTGLLVDALSHQESQLVGILAGSRDTDGALRRGREVDCMLQHSHCMYTAQKSREQKHSQMPTHPPSYTPTHRPVVVEVTEFVGEPLEVVRFER